MLKWMNKKRNKKGFTLIELVVVIAILGILAAIAVPRLTGFRGTAAVAADEASAETIAKAAELYAATYNLDETQKAALSISALYHADVDMIDEDSVIKQQDGTAFTLDYDTTNKVFLVK